MSDTAGLPRAPSTPAASTVPDNQLSRAETVGADVSGGSAQGEPADSIRTSGLRIGMAVYGDITHDSRVRREAEALARAGHKILLVCLPGTRPTAWSPAGIRVVSLPLRHRAAAPGTPRSSSRRGALRMVEAARWVFRYVANLNSWGRQAVAAVSDADVWHLHDLPALVTVGQRLPRGTPLVYDSHELYLETGLVAHFPGPLRSVLSWWEGHLVRRADTLVTVNDALAEVLRRRYRPQRTVVVYNSPPGRGPSTRVDVLRAATGIPVGTQIVIHHGLLAPAGRLEYLVEAMLEPGLEEVHLVLLGYGPLRDALAAMSRESRFGGRVHVLDAVPPDEVVNWISTADVEVVPRPGVDLNVRLSTPNKLFESLSAGVPLVVSDLPGMRGIVVDPEGPLGTVCDPGSPATIAQGLREILELPAPQRAELRRRCRDAAAHRWNWERQVQRLVETYTRLSVARAH